MIKKVLQWGYNSASTGFLGFQDAYGLAMRFKNNRFSLDEQVSILLNNQTKPSAFVGFLSGVGGLALLPVSLPAHFISTIYIQIRMVMAIAILAGYDIRNQSVKSMVYICLIGDKASDIGKEWGVKMNAKALERWMRYSSYPVLSVISQRVARTLGVQILGNGVFARKMIPCVSGIIGSKFDVMTTNAIGKMAKKVFVDNV